MDRVGVQSIPIVCLVLFCIGAILALQMAPILKQYGDGRITWPTSSPSPSAASWGRWSGHRADRICRRSIAAEIGTMVVSEEIEALEAHAIDPIRFLVLPRVLATTVMMVCIAVIGDFAGVVGRAGHGNGSSGHQPDAIFHRTFRCPGTQGFPHRPGESRRVWRAHQPAGVPAWA